MFAFGWMLHASVPNILKPLDPGTGGHQISWLPLAYVLCGLGFLLAMFLGVMLVRLLSLLVMFASVVGGFALICHLLNSKEIRTWEQLAVATLVVGVAAAWVYMTAELYASDRTIVVTQAPESSSTPPAS